MAALTLRRGVDWGAPDNRPVDLAFMVAVPPDAESAHLLILARLVNLLSDETLVRNLRACVSREDPILRPARPEASRFALTPNPHRHPKASLQDPLVQRGLFCRRFAGPQPGI